MSVKKLEPPAVTGFPAKLWAFAKQIAARVDRPIEVIFATDSLAAIAKVDETDEKITITLPRGTSLSLPKPTDNAKYVLGYDNKKLVLFPTDTCPDDG